MKKSFPSYKYIFFGNFYFYSPKNMSSRFLFLVSKNEIWISNFSFYSRFYFLGSRQCLVGDVCARYLSVLGLRFFLKGSHSRKGSVNGGRCIQHTNLTIIIGKKRLLSKKTFWDSWPDILNQLTIPWEWYVGCTIEDTCLDAPAPSHMRKDQVFSAGHLPPVRTGSNQPA